MKQRKKRTYDWEKNPAIEDLPEGTYEYVLTEAMTEEYKYAMDDPDALFPTIAGRHDDRVKNNVYEHGDSVVNTRTMIECFNPPAPNTKLRVSGRIAGRYIWRGRRYIVTEATCKDEDGRLIDRLTTIHMSRPEEVGKKWS